MSFLQSFKTKLIWAVRDLRHSGLTKKANNSGDPKKSCTRSHGRGASTDCAEQAAKLPEVRRLDRVAFLIAAVDGFGRTLSGGKSGLFLRKKLLILKHSFISFCWLRKDSIWVEEAINSAFSSVRHYENTGWRNSIKSRADGASADPHLFSNRGAGRGAGGVWAGWSWLLWSCCIQIPWRPCVWGFTLTDGNFTWKRSLVGKAGGWWRTGVWIRLTYGCLLRSVQLPFHLHRTGRCWAYKFSRNTALTEKSCPEGFHVWGPVSFPLSGWMVSWLSWWSVPAL